MKKLVGNLEKAVAERGKHDVAEANELYDEADTFLAELGGSLDGVCGAGRDQVGTVRTRERYRGAGRGGGGGGGVCSL